MSLALIRADLERREVVLPGIEAWRPAAVPGIERRLLVRTTGDHAGETSIIRCAPATAVRIGGEEILVLAGTLHDRFGDYAEGTYLRDPGGVEREGWAGVEGVVLFVQQRLFAATDTRRVLIDTRSAKWRHGMVPGLTVLPLHQHESEHVALVRWAPGTRFRPHRHWGGEEILVLEGVFQDEHGIYPAGTWFRNPHLSEHHPFTGPEGALILVKTGHLGED